MKKYKKENLLFVPLGGAGEIGMNCYLYHYNGHWIMVDLGITFSDSMSSYDLIMPDLQFVLDKKISAIILTHAHEDHIGAVPYLYEKISTDVPIYSTSFTASVLKRKFESQNKTSYNLRLLEYNKEIKIGDFGIEILALTHSIPEPNGIIIRTKRGNVFHTGDWKVDPNPLVGKPIDEKKLEVIKNQGIRAMICDSTNVFDENHSGSEEEVRNSLKKIFSEFKNGKIIVTCFSSNIARLESILKVSGESNRSCLFLGRSIHRIYESATENSYLSSEKNIISEKEAQHIPDENLVVICTGSQGESNASLIRLAKGNHKYLRLDKQDLIIFSSREIPGNEKRINDLKMIISKAGCKILDQKNSFVHVSGHPSKKELKKMYEWISPDILIPVHGEYRHLEEHRKFANKSGIAKTILVQNGDLTILDSNSKAKIIDNVPIGRNVLKGSRVLSINNKIFSHLDLINSNGEIFVAIILNLDNELVTDPIVFCPSIFEDANDMEILKDNIVESLNEIINSSYDDKVICEQIKSKTKSYIRKKIGLKPLTYVEIVRI